MNDVVTNIYRQVFTHLDSVLHVIGHLTETSVEPYEHDVKSYVMLWSVYMKCLCFYNTTWFVFLGKAVLNNFCRINLDWTLYWYLTTKIKTFFHDPQKYLKIFTSIFLCSTLEQLVNTDLLERDLQDFLYSFGGYPRLLNSVRGWIFQVITGVSWWKGDGS